MKNKFSLILKLINSCEVTEFEEGDEKVKPCIIFLRGLYFLFIA